jgi:hypothetical protein
MTSTNADTGRSLWYVYGIVPSATGSDHAPTGLDGRAVHLERDDDAGIAALVSQLDASEYAPALIEERSAGVEWLGPRATAHDGVLTWVSDRGPVIPLPMFSLFSGRDAVLSMLRERAPALGSTLARIGDARELALRVYRVDDELLAVIGSLSPRLRELEASAASASPGQRYLLERKLDGEKRGEMRAVTQEIADDIVASLRAAARDVVRSPIPRTSGEPSRGTMVLNAAFLVARDAMDTFQRALTDVVARHGVHGFRFDFTGPWPPYHFVNEQQE